jgi:hypothetical protein
MRQAPGYAVILAGLGDAQLHCATLLAGIPAIFQPTPRALLGTPEELRPGSLPASRIGL